MLLCHEHLQLDRAVACDKARSAGEDRHFTKYGHLTHQKSTSSGQKIVFIGIRMDEDSIRKVLNECLVNSAELQSEQSTWLKHGTPWDMLEGCS